MIASRRSMLEWPFGRMQTVRSGSGAAAYVERKSAKFGHLPMLA